MSEHGIRQRKCSTCGERGHNARTCPERSHALVRRRAKLAAELEKIDHELRARDGRGVAGDALRLPTDKYCTVFLERDGDAVVLMVGE